MSNLSAKLPPYLLTLIPWILSKANVIYSRMLYPYINPYYSLEISLGDTLLILYARTLVITLKAKLNTHNGL